MTFDTQLFRAINNLAGKSVDIDSFFVFGATTMFLVMWIIFVIMLFVTYKIGDEQSLADRFRSWFVSPWSMFKRLPWQMTFVAVLSSLVSYAIAQFIGFAYFRSRPFVVLENVVMLVEKSSLDKSFPSDHATLSFVLAFSVWWYNKRWGTLLLVLAAFVSFSRVYSGVHFPLDIVGGLLLAVTVSYTTKKIVDRFS